MKPEILALIPARGGSKGIPRKNIRDFAGVPLIAWSIAAARQSNLVTRTIVSTDDEEIAAVARSFGAETPFLRPAEFAQDATTDLPVFEHALRWLAENENYHPDVVIQLRPTSPIRPRDCVDRAIRILRSHPDADCVRGVVPAGQNPHKMWRLPSGEDAPMQNLLDVEGLAEPYNAPRQILPPVYWQTGHIDAIRAATILEKKSMSGEAIYPLVIDPRYSVDLDNLSDWAKYEWLATFGGLDFVTPGPIPARSPGHKRRSMPEKVDLLVLDFDGVITDNRVWTDQDGRETVASNRSDSEGLSRLRKAGVEAVVISKEVNPVVAARCQKLKVPFVQGIQDKGPALTRLLEERGVDPAHAVYLGNDTNDLPCFPLVGWAAAVADAQPEVRQAADFVLGKPGGRGAVRELCDMILKNRRTS
ncbi:MAG: N-acylneuraminate cytidylyltransferase [Anaerolineaceae bacterium]|nr:MAG: N-acylneuraminate cytidylyltransferase [Anaerolineaceae bacterium]